MLEYCQDIERLKNTTLSMSLDRGGLYELHPKSFREDMHSRCGKDKARLFIRCIIGSDTPDNRSTKFAGVKRGA